MIFGFFLPWPATALSPAPRSLGVNHSTVLRRVGAFEQAIGARLFDRLPGGYALTQAGDEMYTTALSVEDEMAAVQRRLSGRDADLSGSIRVTTIDIMALYLLPKHIAAFRSAHPRIQ